MTDCTCHWQPARLGQPMDADLDPACPIHGAAVVSSSPDIPDEAVEAALASLAQHQYDVEDSVPWMRRALVAAYPALTRQAVATERERWVGLLNAFADNEAKRTNWDGMAGTLANWIYGIREGARFLAGELPADVEAAIRARAGGTL